uniref:Uncharacterized protein n=1 Tax=Anguilla anguilla TaxID=7936 RepID=A0A0E9W6J8_ANGAN
MSNPVISSTVSKQENILYNTKHHYSNKAEFSCGQSLSSKNVLVFQICILLRLLS